MQFCKSLWNLLLSQSFLDLLRLLTRSITKYSNEGLPMNVCIHKLKNKHLLCWCMCREIQDYQDIWFQLCEGILCYLFHTSNAPGRSRHLQIWISEQLSSSLFNEREVSMSITGMLIAATLNIIYPVLFTRPNLTYGVKVLFGASDELSCKFILWK